MAKGTDNFAVALVSAFRAYASSVDPTNADPRILIQGSQNVYKTSQGTIANRPGRKLYDASTDDTVAGCKAGFVWNTSLGATLIIREANLKLQFYSAVTGTGAWYDLLTSLTKTRFVFDTWWDNTDKKDKLLMANGTAQTIYDWAGGIALFVSYAANVITLDRDAATAGFAASGSVTINGVDYTYSGISGSTLTGTSDASAAVANQVTYSKIKTITSFTSGPASTYPCDFLRVVNNQLYLGSYTSQIVYLSKDTSYTDFSSSTPRLTGEGDTLILDAPGKGIGVRDGKAHVFYGTSWLAIISFAQIAVGSTLAEQTDITKVPLGNAASAQGHEFIDAINGNIIYLDQANQARGYGTFRNLFQDKSVLLSQPVTEELADTDFTGGQLRVLSDRRGDLVYITAPNVGKVFIYQERTELDATGNVSAERLWQPPQLWGVSRVDAIAGSAIGFSSSNPQTYYLWDTNQWHDDSPSGQLPYQSIALFSYQNGNTLKLGRERKIEFDKFYVEGYMTEGSGLYLGMYYDYQGATSLLSPTINDSTSLLIGGKQFFSGVVPPSLGDASLGDNPLGDGLVTTANPHDLLSKFRAIVPLQPIQVFEYAPMVYSVDAGAQWELLALGANISQAAMQGVELVKP